ncbi:MAG: oligosaccharide flippase family protein [Actinomycetes bacterium]
MTDDERVLGNEEPAADADESAGPSLGTTAARGFLWANVGIVVRYGSGLVLAAVLARTLNPAAYAVMVTLMIVTFYFDNALDLGMGAALVYEQETGISRRVQVAFTANVALAAILAAAAFVAAPLLTSYFKLDGATPIFRCLAIVVLLSGLTTVPWALFTREMDFRTRSGVEVCRDATRLVVTIGLVVAGVKSWAVILGLIAAYAVWMVLTWILVAFRPTFAWDRVIVGELWSYAWKLAGTRLLGILSLNGDYLVVGNRNPRQYPLYYQAFRLPEVVMGGQLNAMSAVLFPMYSRIRSEGTAALRSAMHSALRLVALFSIPVGVGLALVARDSMLLMYGRTVAAGVTTMELIALTGCVVGLGFATGDLLFAIGRPGVMVRLNAVMVPTMLAAMWFAAPHGIQWVAAVHLLVALVFTGARQLIVNHIVEATVGSVVATLVPGLVVAACVAAAALPVRLATDASLVSLVEITIAGSVGGAIALAVCRPARVELRELVAKVRG